MALTRVVQKAARARVHSSRKRTRKARINAGMKASAAHRLNAAVGRKITASTPATTNRIGRVTNLEDRLSEISEWIGWTGFSRANERPPWRTRYSYSYMTQV